MVAAQKMPVIEKKLKGWRLNFGNFPLSLSTPTEYNFL